MTENLKAFPWLDRAPYLLLAVLVTFVGVTFVILTEKTPTVADTVGYIHAGIRLADGDGLTFEDANNKVVGQFFSPFAFQIKHPGDSRMYLGFPPGLPILLALPVVVLGMPDIAFFVVPAMAVLGLVLTFFLGKFVTNNAWSALLATILIITAPAYWQFGTDAWSEIPSLVFVVAGVWLFLQSRKETNAGKNLVYYSVLSGGILIYSLFIRYANITFLVSIGIAEFLSNPTQFIRPSKKWVFYFVLGIGLCLILAFNYFYYGGLSLTSYSPENAWYDFPPFSLAYALGPSPVNGYSLIAVIKLLWVNFSVLILLAPVGIFLLPKQYRLLFLLSILSSASLYGIYAFAAEGINGRFLLPIFPFLAILSAETVLFLAKKMPNRAIKYVGLAILLLFLGWRVPSQMKELLIRNSNSGNAVDNLQAWIGETPENAVFASYAFNDLIVYYGQRSVLNYRRIPQYDPSIEKYRFEMFEPCLVYAIDTLLFNETPVYYIEDGDPPLYNSKVVLQKYYELIPYIDNPKVFTVQAAALSVPREVKDSCVP